MATDDYFDQLDAALTKRAEGVRPSRPGDSDQVPTLDSVLGPEVTPPAEPIVTEALIAEVTRRVVERLGTQAIRAIVADVVADVAERLVREEIARIRNKS